MNPNDKSEDLIQYNNRYICSMDIETVSLFSLSPSVSLLDLNLKGKGKGQGNILFTP